MLEKGKRILSMILALAVLVSLSMFAGCDKEEESKPESTTASGETQKQETEVKEPPITLTIIAPSAPVTYTPGVQDDAVAKEITKRTGVILDITPANAEADVYAKIGALMASNDLPDLVWLQLAKLQSQAMSAKLLLPMDDYLDEYGKNMKEQEYKVQFSRDYWSVDVDGESDGKFYFYGCGGEVKHDPLQLGGIYLRWDLYKKLNYPKYETLDDLIPILKDMLKLEPENMDGKKNFAFGGRFGQPGGHWELNNYASMFGIAIDWWFTFAVEMNEFKAIPQVTDPNSEFYEIMTFWNKAYREGLLDPDSFIQKNEQWREKLDTGRYMMNMRYPGEAVKYLTPEGQDDKDYFQMPSPVKGEYYYGSYTDPAGSYQIGVSAKCKYPEKAVEFIDFLASFDGTELLRNGVQGVHWDLVDGKPKVKQEIVEMYLNDPDFSLKTGITKYENLAGRGPMVMDPRYNCPVNFFYSPEVVQYRMTPVMEEACDYFNVQIPSEMITKNFKNYIFDNRPHSNIFSMEGSEADDAKDIRNQLGIYIVPQIVELISAKTEGAFEEQKAKIVEYTKNMGVQKVVDVYNSNRIYYQD